LTFSRTKTLVLRGNVAGINYLFSIRMSGEDERRKGILDLEKESVR